MLVPVKFVVDEEAEVANVVPTLDGGFTSVLRWYCEGCWALAVNAMTGFVWTVEYNLSFLTLDREADLLEPPEALPVPVR